VLKSSHSEALLTIQNLHKSFGKKVVHRGVNLVLNKGEILGLFGGSGTGKSVVLRSIIGLEKPDRGSIFF
jgi:phospholipid/cholesterol/gamma-HCH transport system ATP-binding protein